MTNMIRCFRCSGHGKSQGMGWIESECTKCNGSGKIEKPTSSFDTTMLATSVDNVSCETTDSDLNVKDEDVKQVVASKELDKKSVFSKSKRA